MCCHWLNVPPSTIGKSWNAGPHDPGPRSPVMSPRFAHFASVAHGLHHLHPNFSRVESVRPPLTKQKISPMACFQKELISRSVMRGKPLLRLKRSDGGAIKVIASVS